MICRNLAAVALSLLILTPACLVAQDASELEGTPLAKMDLSTLQIELEHDQREYRNFKILVDKLESASKKSSNTDRSRAINNLRDAMAEKILEVEDHLGSEHTIRRHGQEADVMTTQEMEEETAKAKLPQTGRRIMYEGPADLYNAFYRMVRMQEIFVTCRTIESQAISKETRALSRYQAMVNEFARLMNADIQEIEYLIYQVEAAQTEAALADSLRLYGKGDNDY